ncbi:MAG: hypothetical protein ACYC9Y_01505 [Candidatus Methylomirabilia bacterium]
MANDLIRGKVARILNSRELAITVGEQNGVVVGMHFDVLDPKGEDITDPDTGEVLGSVERPKVRVKVVRVQPRLSIASTYKKYNVNIGGKGSILDGGLTAWLQPEKIVTKYETLRTTEKTWEDLDEKDSFVKTGDPVVEVAVAEAEVQDNKK